MQIYNISTTAPSLTQPDGFQASWTGMLELYNQMKTAAANLSFELAQNPPNWAAIETDIGSLKKDCTQMEEMAASLPGDQSALITTLHSMSNALNCMLGEMQFSGSTNEKDDISKLLNFFENGMSAVFQAIVQG